MRPCRYFSYALAINYYVSRCVLELASINSCTIYNFFASKIEIDRLYLDNGARHYEIELIAQEVIARLKRIRSESASTMNDTPTKETIFFRRDTDSSPSYRTARHSTVRPVRYINPIQRVN